jgi:uncharacterized coiled-coil protein SlyX
MTDLGGLEEAILLRMVDRLVTLEQQTATSLATIGSLSETIADLRRQISGISTELSDLRERATATMSSFEQMQRPLQSVLDLKQKLSGGWLVVTAFILAVGYLLQPMIAQLFAWRAGPK